MIGRRAGLLGALVAGTLVGGAIAAGPAIAVDHGMIAFTTTVYPKTAGGIDVEHAHNEIFTIRRNGTGLKQLTFRGDNDSAQWGPFGGRILFRRDDRLWVMGPYGGHQHRVLPKNYDTFAAAWSPGGGRIAFIGGPHKPPPPDARTAASAAMTGFDLRVFSFATGQITVLHVPGTTLYPDSVTWAPDGSRLAFTAEDPAVHQPNDFPAVDLYTVRLDGTELTKLTNTPDWQETTPDWSPDGSRLVYARAGGPRFCEELDTIKPDGTDRQRLHAGCQSPGGPTWTPSGRHVLAYRGTVRNSGIWMMSPTGAHQRFIVSGLGGDMRPARRHQPPA